MLAKLVQRCHNRYSKLEYKGIELDPSIWANVHQDLGSLLPAEYSVEVIKAGILFPMDG